MKMVKEFYIKHLNNISFAIIEFLFIVFLLANIGFIIHIPITWIYLVIALLIVYFSLIKLNNSFNSNKFSNKHKKDFLNKIKNKSDEEIYRIMEEYLNLNSLKKFKFRLKLELIRLRNVVSK